MNNLSRTDFDINWEICPETVWKTKSRISPMKSRFYFISSFTFCSTPELRDAGYLKIFYIETYILYLKIVTTYIFGSSSVFRM